MDTIKWLEDKTKLVLKQLEIFLSTEVANNYYPIICNYLCTHNDLKYLEKRSFEDPDILFKALMCFQKVIAKINLDVVFVASRENFCMFMGWTAKFYNDMLESSSEDVRAMMMMIEDYIIDSQLSAGQQGLLKQSLTKFRAQTAGEHGHSLITQKEQLSTEKNKTQLKTKEQLIAELKGMGLNTSAKQLK